MAGMVIEVQAPIFVFREWHRHRTQSYNEMSARYTEIPELFYVPSYERMAKSAPSLVNKQASGESLEQDLIDESRGVIENASKRAFDAYRILLTNGVSREVARLTLPVNTYSRMRASANLRNWLAFLTLRQAENAQFEIRQYANAVSEFIAEAFPRTHALFVAGR
jgi:thymidylate synthase (FAD)